MMAAYDGIRIFRKIIPHSNAAVAVEDLVYWLLSGVCIFQMLYQENSGANRGFAISAVVLGMLVYLQFSKIVKKIGKKLHNSIKKVIINFKSF